MCSIAWHAAVLQQKLFLAPSGVSWQRLLSILTCDQIAFKISKLAVFGHVWPVGLLLLLDHIKNQKQDNSLTSCSKEFASFFHHLRPSLSLALELWTNERFQSRLWTCPRMGLLFGWAGCCRPGRFGAVLVGQRLWTFTRDFSPLWIPSARGWCDFRHCFSHPIGLESVLGGGTRSKKLQIA